MYTEGGKREERGGKRGEIEEKDRNDTKEYLALSPITHFLAINPSQVSLDDVTPG